MNAFADNDLVLVSPRYLAGSGSKLADALGPLIHLFHWHHHHDPASGHIGLDSPCGSMFVDFEPTRHDGMWWNVRHQEPYWQAQFSRQTPIETIAAVTQALPQLLDDTRHADRIPLTPQTIAQSAGRNSWTSRTEEGTTVRTSPDGHCVLTHEPSSELTWQIRNSLYEGVDTEWSATFTFDTPEPVVAQFFAHLTSGVPVERVFAEVPFLVRDSASALITPVRDAAVNPHTHHAVAQADQAHTDRHRRR
ncbi:DUF317 domain-containing protein [Streptomyces murinus]|uniref:DUF317 domain-containing protein n=1 Tax=Streptomyces murinus TaxID=33900 RepID=UPI0036E1C50E